MPSALPRISVVVPLYNKENYVVRAVESALSQGAAVHEVIVVDDGSTDSGPALLASLADTRVRLIRQQNGGVSAARNTGIEAASGEYVAFLDADDAWLPGYVDALQTLMQEFPLAGLYATSYVRVWPDGKRQEAFLPALLDRHKAQWVGDPFRAWSRSAFFFTSSLCVRRAVLQASNIQFPVGESQGEDQDVIFRLMETTGVAFSPKPLTEYTQAVANSLSSTQPERMLPCYVRLLQRARAPGYPAQHRRGALRVIAVNYLNVARTLISRGRRREAARLIVSREAMRHPTYWLRTAVCWMNPTGDSK